MMRYANKYVCQCVRVQVMSQPQDPVKKFLHLIILYEFIPTNHRHCPDCENKCKCVCVLYDTKKTKKP